MRVAAAGGSRAPGSTVALEISLLGGLSVRCGHRELDVPGGKAHLLLAYLVEHRDRAIDRADLIEALWPADPPVRPEVTVRPLLSRLRAALGVELLRGRGVGRVELPVADVDTERVAAVLERARSALSEGLTEEAARQARVAVRLYEREFLPGLDAPWIDERRRELEDDREEALRLLASAALSLQRSWLEPGRQAARELVKRDQCDERGHALLMRLHAAVGEIAEALRVYESLRRRLRDELGTIPSAELRELHAELLQADAEAVPVRPGHVSAVISTRWRRPARQRRRPDRCRV
jgi:DNA-binding SARP family transcriptional activator